MAFLAARNFEERVSKVRLNSTYIYVPQENCFQSLVFTRFIIFCGKFSSEVFFCRTIVFFMGFVKDLPVANYTRLVIILQRREALFFRRP